MDKDRMIGSAKVAKREITEAAGKAIGDVQLEAAGKAYQIGGKVQNAIGSIKTRYAVRYPWKRLPSRRGWSAS